MGLTAHGHNALVLAWTYARLTVLVVVFLAGRAAAFLAVVLVVASVVFLGVDAVFFTLGFTAFTLDMADCAALLA